MRIIYTAKIRTGLLKNNGDLLGGLHWKRGRTHQHDQINKGVSQHLQTLFWTHERRNGSRRLAAQHADKGHSISLYKTRKLLLGSGLKAIQPRSFVPKTTESRHTYAISSNLLKNRAFPSSLNQMWVGDITYIPMEDGSFEYLSMWMDLCSWKA